MSAPAQRLSSDAHEILTLEYCMSEPTSPSAVDTDGKAGIEPLLLQALAQLERHDPGTADAIRKEYAQWKWDREIEADVASGAMNRWIEKLRMEDDAS